MHHFGSGDGRLSAGCSAGSEGPRPTAATSWRSGSATVTSFSLKKFFRGDFGAGMLAVAYGRGRGQSPTDGDVLALGIQRGRRCPTRTQSHAAGEERTSFGRRDVLAAAVANCVRVSRVRFASAARGRYQKKAPGFYSAGNLRPCVRNVAAPGQIRDRSSRRGVGGVHCGHNDG